MIQRDPNNVAPPEVVGSPFYAECGYCHTETHKEDMHEIDDTTWICRDGNCLREYAREVTAELTTVRRRIKSMLQRMAERCD